MHQWTLQNVKSEGYLNVSGGDKHNGTNVQIWNNPSSPHSQWRIFEVKPGVFVLENTASGKALNVSGGKVPNGTNVQQWDNPASSHSQWKLQ
mgnify:FL=1